MGPKNSYDSIKGKGGMFGGKEKPKEVKSGKMKSGANRFLKSLESAIFKLENDEFEILHLNPFLSP